MKRLRDDVSIERLNRIGQEYLPGFLGVEMIELTEGALRRRMPVKKRHFAPNGKRDGGLSGSEDTEPSRLHDRRCYG